MVYNNNQQTTSLMYYNDSNYFDQHFDGKNKSIYMYAYIFKMLCDFTNFKFSLLAHCTYFIVR